MERDGQFAPTTVVVLKVKSSKKAVTANMLNETNARKRSINY